MTTSLFTESALCWEQIIEMIFIFFAFAPGMIAK